MTADQKKNLITAINLIGEGRPHSAQIVLRKLLSDAQTNPFTYHWQKEEDILIGEI
jgi:hypothetical protein